MAFSMDISKKLTSRRMLSNHSSTPLLTTGYLQGGVEEEGGRGGRWRMRVVVRATCICTHTTCMPSPLTAVHRRGL